MNVVNSLIGCMAVEKQDKPGKTAVLGSYVMLALCVEQRVLYHKTRNMWCAVHGDDFSVPGFDQDLDFIEQVVKDNFEVKIRGRLGPGPKRCSGDRHFGPCVAIRELGLFVESRSSTQEDSH